MKKIAILFIGLSAASEVLASEDGQISLSVKESYKGSYVSFTLDKSGASTNSSGCVKSAKFSKSAFTDQSSGTIDIYASLCAYPDKSPGKIHSFKWDASKNYDFSCTIMGDGGTNNCS